MEVSILKTEKESPLTYDFYGFPDHMYKEEFHTNNSIFVVQQIKQEFENGGFASELNHRGIDHGVWISSKVAFLDYNTLSKVQPAEKGLDLPETSLIQVSLSGDEKNFDTHYKLGKVLSKFRENFIWDGSGQTYLIGMVICYNLKDLSSFRIPGKTMP